MEVFAAGFLALDTVVNSFVERNPDGVVDVIDSCGNVFDVGIVIFDVFVDPFVKCIVGEVVFVDVMFDSLVVAFS